MPTSSGPDNPADLPSRERDATFRLPLRLTLSGDFSHGRLDGAWWPRSRNLETELADLVRNFPAGVGRIIRAVCSRADWERAPLEVRVDGETLKVGQFPHDGAHMVILTLPGRNLTLLLVPPDTSEAQAAEVMRVATSPTNHASAHDVLVAALATSPARAVPVSAVPVSAVPGSGEPETTADHWDDHGESWWEPHPVPPSYRLRAPRRTSATSRVDANTLRTPPAIEFQEDGGAYNGRAASGRQWRISEVLTGWRLEFRDAGDTIATNAGIHRTVEAAIAEASR